MKFNDLIAGKSLSIANLLSLSDKNLAKKIKEHEFKYISCIEDSELGGENLIRCEIGSISYVLALLCKYANLSCDEFFSELDDGLISGECNVGEEEFEELGEWIKDVKNIIIDDSFFTHPDKDAIFWLLEILGKNVVLAGSEVKEFANIKEMDELRELENFDGAVVYLNKNASDEIVGGVQFGIVAKAKDGEILNLKAKDFSVTAKFKLDHSLKGTVAIFGAKDFDGYAFKQVVVSK
ncbi:hypothetical protein [Campylobacter concisus]|uniref:hypothetical protein n=1 Tax=Campylobacter concisus TaxID=199 RepID=UPI000D36CE82|nr:hypothetical protein [Campylobacter concisus]